MRILNSVGVIGGVSIIGYCFYVIQAVQELLSSAYKTPLGYSSFFVELLNIALNGAFIMILAGIFYLVLYIVNLKHIKRNTTKVLSIVGICFSAFLFVFNIAVIASKGNMEFGMIYLGWGFFGLISFAFSIALFVQVIREHKGQNRIEDEESILHEVEVDFEVE